MYESDYSIDKPHSYECTYGNMNPSPQISSENLIKSIDNLINICENTPSQLSRHREKLNLILNDLNSTEFKYVPSLEVTKRTEDVVRVLSNVPLAEDTIIVKCARLIVQLLGKNLTQISTPVFRQALLYLISFINEHKFVGICDALRLMQVLIKNHIKNESVVIGEESAELLLAVELLVNLIKDPDAMKKTDSCHYDGYTSVEIKSSAVFCLETILTFYDKIPSLSDHEQMITEILLRLIYSVRLDDASHQNYCVLMRAALSSCRYIGFSNKDWCTTHIGDILGACIANMLFGLPDFSYQPPQRVQTSQQTLLDVNASTSAGKKGGKMIKGRKPRQAPQYKNRKNPKSSEKINGKGDADDLNEFNGHSMLFDSPSDKFVVSIFTTSESESDSEAVRTGNNNRDKEAKLRLAALSLLTIVAKNVEKKVFFGYWHCLFPTEDTNSPFCVSLVNCVLRDSNQRCRITALQATSIILYGMKSFLVLAESTDKPPTNFMPFSISLGNQIRVLYANLTQALTNESSLPVLTQILKCLAALVQSTSFQKLQKPPGLIRKFVVLIRRLVHHKDPTIKVAALIVMEFLIARPEITNEISDCVGLSRLDAETKSRVHDFGEDEVIETEENVIDSEYEDDEEAISQAEVKGNDSAPKISWLLQIALEFLGVTVCNYIKPSHSANSLQVRHQSQQIILMMAPHYIWIKPHLLLIAQALENTLQDDIATVRHRAARCLDIVAHSISTHLIAQSNVKSAEFEADVEMALLFWSKMLQIVTEQLQDVEQSATTKSIFCDAYSNIGVHVYERLPRQKQIQIISLLSGLSLGDDEAIVRASAVRALAIFVLFPSLKEDICYIENTTEAILQIIKDESLPVRIKVSWALANITDALVMNILDSSIDQISEKLLLRLFETTSSICNDNDKVRTNAARILGNLLRLINVEQVSNKKWHKVCMDAIRNLTDQAKLVGTNSNMKVKWNACYAIGNFMKNPVIFELDTKECCWQTLVFETLSEVVVKCANFKVRINGASALAVPTKRSHYGKHYLSVWSALTVALYQANCLTDFNEYNHRDNLLDQLCITISHLIGLASLDDLVDIENVLLQHIDSTKQNWIRVINRMVPEKAASLLAANVHLKNMTTSTQILHTNEQKNAIHTLLNCFVSITEYDD